VWLIGSEFLEKKILKIENKENRKLRKKKNNLKSTVTKTSPKPHLAFPPEESRSEVRGMITPLANSHTDPVFLRTNTDCDIVLCGTMSPCGLKEFLVWVMMMVVEDLNFHDTSDFKT
jgi:hypothetical protein